MGIRYARRGLSRGLSHEGRQNAHRGSGRLARRSETKRRLVEAAAEGRHRFSRRTFRRLGQARESTRRIRHHHRHARGEKSGAATAEIALGLLLSAARFINRGDASIRKGGFQGGVPAGEVLDGKTLVIIGLGKIGSRMARYGVALGMQIIAWSANLTEEKAKA